MARIRMIKPEFFDDPDLAEVSFAARLFFIGLWLQADRDGRLEDNPKRLKARIFPYDDVNVHELAMELHGKGVIRRYRSRQGVGYIWIRSFVKHQRPHPKEPESVIPPFDDASLEPDVEKHGEPWKNTEGTPESESESGIRNLYSGTRKLEPQPPPPPRPRTFGRITLHRWQLEELINALGPHAADFGLDEWVDGLSATADQEGLALEKSHVWPWVQDRFRRELGRRGIKIATAAAPSGKSPSRSDQLTAMLARVAALDPKGQS